MNNDQNPIFTPQAQNQPSPPQKTGWKNIIIVMIAVVILIVIGIASYVYLSKTTTSDSQNSTSSNDSAQSTTTSTDMILAAIKSKLDSSTYEGVSDVTPSTDAYILEETGYSVMTYGSGYTLTYSDTKHLVKNGADKTLVKKAFPSMDQFYSDMQTVFTDSGLTLDRANTYENFASFGPSNGQQVTAISDTLVCVASPVAIKSYSVNATAENPDIYTISVNCSTKLLFTQNLDLQKQLVEVLLKDATFEKSSLIVAPTKQVGNFISASTSSKFSYAGGNRAIFMKKNDAWSFLTYTGQSVPKCSIVDGIGIPTTILDSCLDSSNKTRAPKQ